MKILHVWQSQSESPTCSICRHHFQPVKIYPNHHTAQFTSALYYYTFICYNQVMDSQERTYIAIDLKSFYASVECRERGLDPLTAKLVVADASRTSKTICLAVTPALKAYGLSGRSRLFEVEAKAREILRQTGKPLDYITAVPRMALYIKYSARIYSIYLKYFSPEDIHVYSIDEVFIDATSYLPLYRLSARELAMKVIRNILEETGITATAGISPNLFLCKAAMDIVAKHIPADENGVRIAELDTPTYRKELWDHKPITDFWRVGRGTARKLEKLCIFTMGDLARQSLTDDRPLYKTFGIDAEILIDHAWGYEPTGMKEIKGYHSEAKSLGSGQVLHHPYTHHKAALIVREMAELLALDMYDKKLVTSSLTLMVSFDAETLNTSDFTGETVTDFYGRLLPKPVNGSINIGQETNSPKLFIESLLTLFHRIAPESYLVRKLNVSANDVKPAAEKQPSLFDEPAADSKEDSLQKTRLEIMKKFGKNAILKGMDLQQDATTRDRNAQIGGHKA